MQSWDDLSKHSREKKTTYKKRDRWMKKDSEKKRRWNKWEQFCVRFSLEAFCPGPWFNIKMSSYQYRKSYSGDKTILQPSYLHNGVSYTDKTRSLYWIGALVPRWPIEKAEGSWSLPGTISLPWWRTSSFPRAEDTYVGGPKIHMYGPTISQIHIPLYPGNILFDSLWPSDAISMG